LNLVWLRLDNLQSLPLPALAMNIPEPILIILIVIIAIGGLILIGLAGLIGTLAVALYLQNIKDAKSNKHIVEQVVPEPEMPREIITELSFSTGDDDNEQDNIATEVFVRTESIPPEEAETIDDLPGKLLARTRPNGD
jgi:hypothetical protein